MLPTARETKFAVFLLEAVTRSSVARDPVGSRNEKGYRCRAQGCSALGRSESEGCDWVSSELRWGSRRAALLGGYPSLKAWAAEQGVRH